MLHVIFTILLFTPLGFSAPLDCDKLIQRLDPLNALQHASGRWPLVAGSVKEDSDLFLPLEITLSVSLELGKSSFTQFIRSIPGCGSIASNFTLENNVMKAVIGCNNHTITFFRTSCPDCRLFTIEARTSRQHFYLFSRRRQLEEKEMEEFRAQVECLNMPPPAVMDPTKDLCPEKDRDPEMD
uniref:Uncharacterized protein n=1 Tax=Oryzias latipes TaxID=8090 RepID=A0A3P9J3M4_ORYLA